MEESSEIYQGDFKYIFIPCDPTVPITEHTAPKAGGLEKDALRLLAENHFNGGRENSLSTSVEIISILLPCQDYNFVGVSMYSDQLGKNKNLPINNRAVSVATLCKYSEPIHGDVFFGKYHDDESKPWVRLDFSMDDLKSDAEWIQVAQIKNKEGKKAASTSSVLENMMKQQQGNNNNNTQFISNAEEEKGPSGPRTENEALNWTQSEDEVEVRVKVPGNLKASDFNIQIKSSKLQILLKSGQTIPFSSEGNVGKIFQAGGAELARKIDPDSSSWQLEKSKDGKETTIILTLGKDSKARWLELLA
jgi:HSP20 family molecular chaperone IbpA